MRDFPLCVDLPRGLPFGSGAGLDFDSDFSLFDSDLDSDFDSDDFASEVFPSEPLDAPSDFAGAAFPSLVESEEAVASGDDFLT